jgi:L-threonylcarbamoyladenylate synthase
MTIHPPIDAEVERFGAALRAGEIVAFATETVYGLGADATNSDAVLGIYETKGRPRFNPLIVHVADMIMAQRCALFSPVARRLATLWPGPLTLVMPMQPDAGLSALVTAGLDTVGIRIPSHRLARRLIQAARVPIAAPSANPSGRLSPTTARQVDDAFEGRIPVLDGGPSTSGLESTILRVDGDDVTQLRAGAIPRNELESLLQRAIPSVTADSEIAAPGMLASHYAPNARLRLNAISPRPGEGYLAFGPTTETGKPMCNLSPTGDLREAARNLFAMLHELDAQASAIAVARIPEKGLGEAINDRLRRAAAPRPGPQFPRGS